MATFDPQPPVSRRTLEQWLSRHPSPAGVGGVLVACALCAPSPAAAALMQRRIGPAAHLARGPSSLYAVTTAASETDAWLWGQGLTDAQPPRHGGAVGIAYGVSTESLLDRADLALRFVQSTRQPCATARAADVHDLACAIAKQAQPNAEQRRRHLLRRAASASRPVQLQHVTSHCEDVARAAARLAQLMNLSPAHVEAARLAGLMHDIGKLIYPEDLLAKVQPLSPRERALLNHHARAGALICSALGLDDETCRAVAQHHRRIDDPLPEPHELTARIVCTADALTAMTTARPYSPARSYCQALSELRRGRGSQFDPAVVVAAHMLGAAAMAA